MRDQVSQGCPLLLVQGPHRVPCLEHCVHGTNDRTCARLPPTCYEARGLGSNLHAVTPWSDAQMEPQISPREMVTVVSGISTWNHAPSPPTETASGRSSSAAMVARAAGIAQWGEGWAGVAEAEPVTATRRGNEARQPR